MAQFKRNDTVRILPATSQRYAGLWKVEKVNPVKYVLSPVQTDVSHHRNLTIPHEMVVDPGTTVVRAETVELPEHIPTGAFVTVQNFRKVRPDVLFVVTKNSGEKCNLVPAGGATGADTGRYWNLPISLLRVVDPMTVLAPQWQDKIGALR